MSRQEQIKILVTAIYRGNREHSSCVPVLFIRAQRSLYFLQQSLIYQLQLLITEYFIYSYNLQLNYEGYEIPLFRVRSEPGSEAWKVTRCVGKRCAGGDFSVINYWLSLILVCSAVEKKRKKRLCSQAKPARADAFSSFCFIRCDINRKKRLLSQAPLIPTEKEVCWSSYSMFVCLLVFCFSFFLFWLVSVFVSFTFLSVPFDTSY